jgi:hypothetical protein
MTYMLRRIRDGAGDSGTMSMLIYEKNGKVLYEHNSRPKVGGIMRVGSIYGRTYANQDYWQTTRITEISEDTPERVLFKTTNSEYEWKTNG